jgi:dienelactone hydrolase
MRDLLLGDHYRSVQLSPSGKYLVTTYYTTTSKGENMFRTVVTETNSQNVLMKFPNYVDFKWLPNRDLLFITRKGFNGYELVTINPVTKDEQILASNLPSQNFTISPNEKYLIYYQTEEGVAIKNGIKRLTEPDDRMPGWRNSRYLSLYDLSSGVNRRLTFGTTSAFLNDISPDGNELLISFNRSETNRTPFERTTFVKMNVLTGKVDTLLHDQMFLSSAKFSPDASSLLVKASPGAFDGIGSELTNGQIANAFDYRLYLYSCDDKKVTPLLLHFNSSVSSYQWDKLSNKIFFKATEGCNEKIYSLDPENMFVLEYDLPVSYVQDYSISTTSKNTQIVFFGQTGERAREMFTGILGNQSKIKVNPIGEINFDNLNRHVSIGSCYDWSFLSSRGDSIRGFYFLPPHFNENNQYPLIVYYYGGCTPTPKLLEFQYPLQVLASMGYVVYVCQPSGAIGFGQEFAARHVNTWGEGSANDIIEGTKKFIQSHSFINKNKIGCMGASYGGFMTQYLQTKTDIFTAAISHAGISNIASYWGGGYWGYTYGEIAQYGSFPWNNPDLYVKQSPLFNADKINTPLLLLHGTVDTNVPTNESQQLFTALRILGKPVSYVQIEGQDHVIVDFNKRLLWQKTIFAWFNYWLKDEHAWWEELYPNDKFGLN